MESVVDAVLEQITEDRKIVVVRLEIGARSGVAVHALRFCFDVCTQGTRLAGAQLEIVERPGEQLRLRDVEVE